MQTPRTLYELMGLLLHSSKFPDPSVVSHETQHAVFELVSYQCSSLWPLFFRFHRLALLRAPAKFGMGLATLDVAGESQQAERLAYVRSLNQAESVMQSNPAVIVKIKDGIA
jgi:hypothetical protein